MNEYDSAHVIIYLIMIDIPFTQQEANEKQIARLKVRTELGRIYPLLILQVEEIIVQRI